MIELYAERMVALLIDWYRSPRPRGMHVPSHEYAYQRMRLTHRWRAAAESLEEMTP